MNKKTNRLLIVILAIFLCLPAQAFAAQTVIQPIQPIEITNPDLITDPILITPYQSGHGTIKAVPIYRSYQGGERYGVHYYTMNQSNHDQLVNVSGLSDDGIAGYLSPVPLPYTTALWHMQKSDTDSYFAFGQADREYVIGTYGFVDCGILGYAVPLSDTSHGNAQMHSWYKGDVRVSEFDVWNADHYYHQQVYYIGSPYTYEGPRFRIWSGENVLQEIDVTYPNGGETLTGGTTVDVKWKTLIPGGKISLYYTMNPSDGWAKIADNLENTGSYSWKVPNSATSKAIVEARWTYNGIDANCYDQSDKYVTVKAGTTSIINWNLTVKPIAWTALMAPAAPTALAAGSDSTQVQPKLFWSDNSSNETAFVIERKAEGGSYTQLTQVNPGQTSFVDTRAEKGIRYYYRVKAINGQVSSGYSNEAAAAVYEEPVMLPASPSPAVPAGDVTMQFALNNSTYLVNGETKTMDVSPVSLNGRTMMPVRFVADPLGAVTNWDPVDRKVTVTMGSKVLELWIGNPVAKINGVNTPIDPSNANVMPIIISSRTMLPMRFVTEALGCTVEWIPEGSIIKVHFKGDYLDPQPEPPM